MAHTPGPWFVDGESGNTGESEAISSAGRVVAWSASTYDEDTDSDEVTDEDRDNARLIAAAPELLAVCKRVASDLSMVLWKEGCGYTLCGSPERTETLLREAIAKAEGRTHEE